MNFRNSHVSNCNKFYLKSHKIALFHGLTIHAGKNLAELWIDDKADYYDSHQFPKSVVRV